MADCQSGRHTHPCLQDRHTHTQPYLQLNIAPDRWSWRDTHTHTQPCLQDCTCTDGRSPVRETHTQTPAYKTTQMAGDTHTQPCLQDRTDGRSPVRETHTALPTRPTHTHTHTHTHTQPYLQLNNLLQLVCWAHHSFYGVVVTDILFEGLPHNKSTEWRSKYCAKLSS